MIHDKEVFLVSISNHLTLKYDGLRDRNKWTLLRNGGGRIFDGTIENVASYIMEHTRTCIACNRSVLDYSVKQIGWEQIGTPYNPCWQPTYEFKCEECENDV